jgi:hypothetical protein
MKTILPLTGVLLILISFACKRKVNDPDPTKGFSAKIQQIVPQSIIDDLKTRGMPITEGTVPPNIEGIFISKPHTLVTPYGPEDDYKAGHEFADFIMRFSNQNTTDLSVQIETKNAGGVGTGVGGFIAGNGNKFTLFAELNYVSGTVTAKQIRIFSGEITPNGIKDFYTTILIKEKSDPAETLFPVGKSRILKDKDALADKTKAFRLGTDSQPLTVAYLSDMAH